ncbi:hypothetical protein, partial [Xanthomonas citri]
RKAGGNGGQTGEVWAWAVAAASSKLRPTRQDADFIHDSPALDDDAGAPISCRCSASNSPLKDCRPRNALRLQGHHYHSFANQLK